MMMQMMNGLQNNQEEEKEEINDSIRVSRETVQSQLEKGLLENREITIEVEEKNQHQA